MNDGINRRSFMQIAAGALASAVAFFNNLPFGRSTSTAPKPRHSHLQGRSTGFADLDTQLGGLRNGELIVIGGRPSMGRTTLVLGIARHVALHEHVPVAVFSLRLSKEMLTMRMIGAEGRVDAMRLRSGYLRDSDWPKIAKAATVLGKAPMHIDDSGTPTIDEMRSRLRQLHSKNGLGLVVVDGLQFVYCAGLRFQERMTSVSRSLKSMARDFQCPVVAVSGLDRNLEKRRDKRPLLRDFAFGVEQEADVVMSLYRDEYYEPDSRSKGIAEINVAKNLYGSTGTVRLAWSDQFVRFDGLKSDAA